MILEHAYRIILYLGFAELLSRIIYEVQNIVVT